MIYPDLSRELELMQQGFTYVAGLDEAGRGPWAGPVTAGCVIVTSPKQLVATVRDSKTMRQKARDEAFEQIMSNSDGYGVGIVEASEIDQIGIQKAVLKAMTLALSQAENMIKSKANYIIADGSGIMLIDGYKMEKIIKGDLKHYSIAAASVLAKVTRDRIMLEIAAKYPEYSFEKHVGYGTKLHIEALAKYGPTEIHRKTYKPVAKLLGQAN